MTSSYSCHVTLLYSGVLCCFLIGVLLSHVHMNFGSASAQNTSTQPAASSTSPGLWPTRESAPKEANQVVSFNAKYWLWSSKSHIGEAPPVR